MRDEIISQYIVDFYTLLERNTIALEKIQKSLDSMSNHGIRVLK